jgi:hypothetical protein
MHLSSFRWMCLALAALAAAPAPAATKRPKPSKTAPSAAKSGGEVKMLLGRPITREQFEQLDEALAAMGAFQQAFNPGGEASWEVLPRYASVPAPEDVAEREALAALGAVRTFSLSPWFGRLRASADFRAVPNFPLVQVDLQWKEVRDAKNRKVAFLAPLDASGKPDEKGAVGFEVELAQETELPETLAKWKGSAVATVKVPVRFQRVSFTAADVGQVKEGITLQAWKGGLVKLDDARGRLAQAELVGLAAQGKRLSRSSYSSEQPEERELLEKLAKTKWEEVPAVVEPPASQRVLVSATFNGEPARLDVYLVEKTVERKLPIKLAPGASGSAPAGQPVAAPARALCGEVSEAALRKQVRVFASRTTAMMGYGRPEIAVQFPACDNSLFSEVEFTGLKYLDGAGKPLPGEVEAESSGFMADAYGQELRLSPKVAEGQEERPDAAFRELARVEGVLKLGFPKVRVLSLSRKAPEAEGAALTLKGNKVTVRLPTTMEGMLAKGSFLPEHLEELTAYDAKGRLLKRDTTSVSSSFSGEHVELTVPFFGKPERVDILLVEDRVQVDLPFALKLPPAPEAKASP